MSVGHLCFLFHKLPIHIFFVHFFIGDLTFIFIRRSSLYILISKLELLCALQNFQVVGYLLISYDF